MVPLYTSNFCLYTSTFSKQQIWTYQISPKLDQQNIYIGKSDRSDGSDNGTHTSTCSETWDQQNINICKRVRKTCNALKIIASISNLDSYRSDYADFFFNSSLFNLRSISTDCLHSFQTPHCDNLGGRFGMERCVLAQFTGYSLRRTATNWQSMLKPVIKGDDGVSKIIAVISTLGGDA